MILKINIESADLLELLVILNATLEIAVQNIGDAPIQYSNIARINNTLEAEFLRTCPTDEINSLTQK